MRGTFTWGFGGELDWRSFELGDCATAGTVSDDCVDCMLWWNSTTCDASSFDQDRYSGWELDTALVRRTKNKCFIFSTNIFSVISFFKESI